jgi:hypothetical protein
MCRDARAQTDAGEDDKLDGQCAQVSPRQIVKLSDGSGVEERSAVVEYVLIGSLAGDGGGDDNADEGYKADNVVQGKRRVHQNSAASTKINAGLRNCAAGNGGEQATQAGKHQEINIGRKAAEPLAKFKAENVEHHIHQFTAAAVAGCKNPRMVAK